MTMQLAPDAVDVVTALKRFIRIRIRISAAEASILEPGPLPDASNKVETDPTALHRRGGKQNGPPGLFCRLGKNLT